MNDPKNRFINLKDQRGTVMMEMALMIAFIAIAMISGVQNLVEPLRETFKVAGDEVSGAGGFGTPSI